MTQAQMKDIHIGIDSQHRQDAIGAICQILADTYALRLKTQNFHWNVTGPSYFALHEAFEEQYDAMAVAVDELAERVRKLGGVAPGSLRVFAEATQLDEVHGQLGHQEMVRHLIKDHETMARSIRASLPVFEEARDEATLDLLAQRIEQHESFAWMMRSVQS